MKHTIVSCYFIALAFVNLNLKAQDVAPQTKDKIIYSFTNQNLHFEIDANTGGRITSFKINDSEILVTGSGLTGSTFWPSPQAFWNWPPPAEIDNMPYSCKVENNKLVMKSQKDNSNYLTCYKTFYANTSDTSITIEYVLKNELITPLEWAPWEVTRVNSNGWVFFEKGNGYVNGTLQTQVIEKGNSLWLDLSNLTSTGSTPKLFSDATGWIAFVSNNILFIKQFENISQSNFAPGEAEVEVYYGGQYSEIENQGAYKTINGKDSISWKVKWYARNLPDSLKTNTAGLVSYALKTIKQIPMSIESELNNRIELYPNPAKNLVKLNINPENKNYTITIYNSLGIRKLQQRFTREDINVSQLENGIYFYEIKQNNNLIRNSKLMIVK